MAGEGGRARGAQEKRQFKGSNELSFSNPYPWMSAVEAMVHLALEAHKVPFSWRFFDGEAPTFQQLLVNTGYQPEFTLREYKLVILVTGGFYGTLPGVLDKTALAQVCLEEDGWKVVNLFDQDIRTVGAWNLLLKEMPNLGSITGPLRPNPYGRPVLVSRINHHGHRAVNPQLDSSKARDRNDSSERRHTRRGSGGRSDGDRRRIGVNGAVSGRPKAR